MMKPASDRPPPTAPPRRFRLLPPDSVVGWTPFAWLLYLPTFLIGPIEQTQRGEAGIPFWIITIVGLLVFLASYFRAFWVSGRRLKFHIAFQLALAVGFSFINLGACVIYIYAASFAGQLHPAREGLRWLLLISATGALVALLIEPPPFFWIASVISLLVGGVNLHFTQVGRAQHKLRLAQGEVEHLAAVAERERIARDLHDVLGHTLSLIVLKSELAARLTERDTARAAAEMRDVETVARRTLQEVREAIRGYHPTLADEVVRAAAMLRAAGVRSEIDIGEHGLPQLVEETLALAVREAVTNVVRHAGAENCRIALEVQDGSVTLRIGDDGVGSSAPEGHGLRGMRERVEAFGGRLARTAEGGVTLRLTLPLPPPRPEPGERSRQASA